MKNVLEEIKRNKKQILVILIVLLIIFGVIFFVYKIVDYKINNIDISNSIHGIIVKDGASLYRKPKISKWKHIRDLNIGENVYIVGEFADEENNEWYKVKNRDKAGYVLKNEVDYFKFSKENGNCLMSDVSKFNIQFKHFENAQDYEVFLLNSDINYVYIRAGGRGYGEEGNFYTDSKYKVFIEACEYLKVPYGFYYIDEAITSEEIDEEVKFIKKFLDENAKEHCKLPLVLDIENHDGVGRADKIWEERANLVSELITKFKENNIDTIVYSNAKFADKYLSSLNTKFWLAYYTLENKLPDYWYTETDQQPVQNIELMEKMVAWQFTETGAGKAIPYKVDISLVKNEFFREFVK